MSSAVIVRPPVVKEPGSLMAALVVSDRDWYDASPEIPIPHEPKLGANASIGSAAAPPLAFPPEPAIAAARQSDTTTPLFVASIVTLPPTFHNEPQGELTPSTFPTIACVLRVATCRTPLNPIPTFSPLKTPPAIPINKTVSSAEILTPFAVFDPLVTIAPLATWANVFVVASNEANVPDSPDSPPDPKPSECFDPLLVVPNPPEVPIFAFTTFWSALTLKPSEAKWTPVPNPMSFWFAPLPTLAKVSVFPDIAST